MHGLRGLISIAILLCFIGCAPVYVQHQKPAVQHHYKLSVVDVDGNQLEGVNIEYTMKDDERLVKSISFTTSTDGVLRDSLSVTTDPQYTYLTTYKSSFEYKVSKEGCYPQSGELSSKYGQEFSFDKPIKKKKVILIRPIDYFNKQFASSLSDINLKTKILKFIDLIIIEGLISKSVLRTQSIDLAAFKNDNYLQLKFRNTNVYNSLKLNKYDIGKILFDELIRKILNPLNDYIGESGLFYGYDLSVIGYTESFADEYPIPEVIKYRFLIPEKVARQYKNKDITGQQVLDSSIILLDDERIHLKLQ